MSRDVGPMIVIPIGQGNQSQETQQGNQGQPYGCQSAQTGTATTLGGSATTKVTGTNWDVDAGVDVD